MEKKYIVAFDQGTTSTRAIIFDKKGSIIAISQKELQQYYPQSGWVEHDASAIFNDQLEAFDNVISETGIDASEIASIGITNQRETTVVWDKNTGEPIHKAIVWLDKRTTPICDQLKADGLETYVKENTGLVIDSYFSGTKLKWILDEVPEARKRAEAGELLFGTIDSWLIFKLTQGKNHLTDHSNASRTMIYNIKTLSWDEKMLQAMGIPSSMLPHVQESSSDFGSLDYKGIQIPIYGVAGDQQAALFGQGGHQPGMAKNTYGTGCFLLLNTGKEHLVSKNGLLTTLACSVENEKPNYALEGSIFIGGASIQWLRDQLNLIDHAAETEAICTSIPPLEDLYVVPAFAGLGAPYWDAEARGAIFGLTRDTGKEEITKATLESVVFQSKDLLEAMKKDKASFQKLMVDGGMVATDWFCQKLSNILEVDVARPKIIETTALGAAFLAGVSAGVFEDLDSLREIKEVDKTFSPIEDENRYLEWKEAVEKVLT